MRRSPTTNQQFDQQQFRNTSTKRNIWIPFCSIRQLTTTKNRQQNVKQSYKTQSQFKCMQRFQNKNRILTVALLISESLLSKLSSTIPNFAHANFKTQIEI